MHVLERGHAWPRIVLARAMSPALFSLRLFVPWACTSPQFADTVITHNTEPKAKTPFEELTFGTTFTDHMLEVDWTAEVRTCKERLACCA